MVLYVALLHGGMLDKTGLEVTTSLTLIDVHDLARSSRTFGAEGLFIVHPTAAIRTIARTLQGHWVSGFGATYNENRRDALEKVRVVVELEDVVLELTDRYGKRPLLIATSAKQEGERISYKALRQVMETSISQPYVLLLGTGWGMTDQLIRQTDYFLDPILGVADYNHLSVRSACAIMLDRLRGRD